LKRAVSVRGGIRGQVRRPSADKGGEKNSKRETQEKTKMGGENESKGKTHKRLI